MKLFINKKGDKMNKEELEIIKYIITKIEKAKLEKRSIERDIEEIEEKYKDIEYDNDFFQKINLLEGIKVQLNNEINYYKMDMKNILEYGNA